ncbi:MAG: SirB1 family protein [Tepidisphaeraceae bacterium]
MGPSLPLCSNPAAFGEFAKQVSQIETSAGLLRTSVILAMHQHPGLQADDVEHTLDEYARTIRSRVRGEQPQALLAHLHHHLFDELGFAGNPDDYYSPANSYLPDVLDTKRGLPITLCLVYKIVADKLGLGVHGVGLPGHFIASVDTGAAPLFIDCYDGGRELSVQDCRDRVQSIFGDTVKWQNKMLRPVTHRMWVSRMVQNLLHIFTTTQHWNDVAALLELQMQLWPKQTQLQRDLALVLARIDMAKPASMWLDSYLRSNPNDPEREELTDLLAKLSQ